MQQRRLTLSTPACRVPRLQYSMTAHVSISTAELWASASCTPNACSCEILLRLLTIPPFIQSMAATRVLGNVRLNICCTMHFSQTVSLLPSALLSAAASDVELREWGKLI